MFQNINGFYLNKSVIDVIFRDRILLNVNLKIVVSDGPCSYRTSFRSFGAAAAILFATSFATAAVTFAVGGALARGTFAIYVSIRTI